jgi:hypothetical protein
MGLLLGGPILRLPGPAVRGAQTQMLLAHSRPFYMHIYWVPLVSVLHNKGGWLWVQNDWAVCPGFWFDLARTNFNEVRRGPKSFFVEIRSGLLKEGPIQ